MRTAVRSIIALSLCLPVRLPAQPGALVPSFGNGGMVTTAITDPQLDVESRAVQVQPDGRIVVAGYVRYPDFMSRPFLVRYMPDGSLDGSFGNAGIAHASTGSSIQLNDLQVLSDGKLLVCGAISPTTSTQQQDVYIARYTSSGSLDDTFGSGGSVTLALSSGTDFAVRSLPMPDGRYHILARSGSGAAGTSCLVKLSASGSLDNSFSGDGRLFNLFGAAAPQGVADLALRADGSVLALGGGDDAVKVVAVQENGTLDAGFGTGGTTAVPAGSGLVVRPDGSVLVQGPITQSTVVTLHSTRLLPDGTIDVSFGNAGTAVFEDPSMTGIAGPSRALFYPDGRYMVGWRTRIAGTEEFDGAVTWFQPNGSIASVGTVVNDIGPFDSDQDRVVALSMAPNGDIIALCSYVDEFLHLVVARYEGDLMSTSIGDEQNAPFIKAYPVPASMEVRLVLPHDRVMAGVSLFDVAGQRMMAPVIVQGSSATIDVRQLPSGLYVAEIIADGRVHRQRVQVVR